MSYLGHSISLCARATRAILNYAPIGKYRELHPHVVNQISKPDITSSLIVQKTEYPSHLHIWVTSSNSSSRTHLLLNTRGTSMNPQWLPRVSPRVPWDTSPGSE